MDADVQAKFIIADDHPLCRVALSEALRQTLNAPDIVTIGSFDELSASLHEHDDADLLLLDLNMPGCRGYSALVHARGVAPTLPVIVVSAFEDPSVATASMEHGAAGFIPKSSSRETMAEAVQTVLAGGTWRPDPALSEASESSAFAEKLAYLT